MPTKQELETINDELLTENSQLRREGAEQAERLEALSESLQEVTARLEALASNKQQSATGSPDVLAAQIEPLVAGLRQMIEAARQQTAEQGKRAQYLQAMQERSEQVSEQFMNQVAETSNQTHRLAQYLNEWHEQPRITLWKITGAMFGSVLLAGLLIVSFASWRLQPTRTLQEDATKWRVLTEGMPPERVREIEQQIENKLYNREQRGQIGAQTTGADSPPATSAEPSPGSRR
jgi:archaellum component FlaC